MDFNRIIKDVRKEEYAREITEWKYEGEYADYNLPSYEECKSKNYGITREDRSKNYTVYILDGEVVFYSNMKIMDDNKIYVGVGLKPKYCGKGIGSFFLNDSVQDLKEKYPEYTLYLEVRSWNKRAIKSYEKLGFRITNTIVTKDRLGNDTEFIEMEL